MQEPNDDQVTVRSLMERYGISEVEARFRLALFRGEIDGDVVFIGEPPPWPATFEEVFARLAADRPRDPEPTG